MGKRDQAGQAVGVDRDEEDLVKVEQALVEAHYLGLSLRALAADPDFCFPEITASVGEPLIAWARFVDERLQAGERLFMKARHK